MPQTSKYSSRRYLLATSLVSVTLLSGCATVIKGTTNDIAVVTDPGGAQCVIEREGKQIMTVSETPQTVNLPRDKDPLTVTCIKDGFESNAEIVEASFTGYTVGNILIGGGIGAVVDMATGANSEYPGEVKLYLLPTTFGSEAERDARFDEIQDAIRAEAQAEIDRVNNNCQANDADRCASKVEFIEKQRDEEIQKWEDKRLGTEVASAAE